MVAIFGITVAVGSYFLPLSKGLSAPENVIRPDMVNLLGK
jgi:hypothetical protein